MMEKNPGGIPSDLKYQPEKVNIRSSDLQFQYRACYAIFSRIHFEIHIYHDVKASIRHSFAGSSGVVWYESEKLFTGSYGSRSPVPVCVYAVTGEGGSGIGYDVPV
jgi:hypothetical protein